MMALPGQFKVRPVFYRETASLMYSPWPYMVATLIAELPWLALSLAVGPTLSYFMIGAHRRVGCRYMHLHYCVPLQAYPLMHLYSSRTIWIRTSS